MWQEILFILQHVLYCFRSLMVSIVSIISMDHENMTILYLLQLLLSLLLNGEHLMDMSLVFSPMNWSIFICVRHSQRYQLITSILGWYAIFRCLYDEHLTHRYDVITTCVADVESIFIISHLIPSTSSQLLCWCFVVLRAFLGSSVWDAQDLSDGLIYSHVFFLLVLILVTLQNLNFVLFTLSLVLFFRFLFFWILMITTIRWFL